MEGGTGMMCRKITSLRVSLLTFIDTKLALIPHRFLQNLDHNLPITVEKPRFVYDSMSCKICLHLRMQNETLNLKRN